MTLARLDLADLPEPDDDDRPIIRLLRKQVHERLAQADAESGPGVDLENEARVRLIVHEVVDAHQRLALTTTNTPRLVDPEAAEKELVSDQLGAGPLQVYLEDPNVEEIGVSGVDRVWLWTVDGQKLLVQEPLFESDEDIVELVRRLIRRLQRQFNIASPIVDAALPSGARLNAVLNGTALLGTTVTIRKFPKRYRHLAEIVRTGALTWPCARFLLACVAARANILIAGGMGTGKSTLMDVLLCDGIASPLERIVLIAETHDLSAEQVLPDCVVLQARPPNADQQGEIKQSELFRTSLRMRATRVCVEEVRGTEAWQMLRAFASGHPGGLCTIHSETPRQALATLALYAAEAENNLSPQHVAEWIANSLHLIVQLGFDASRPGHRMIESIAEIDGLEGSTPRLQEIWVRDEQGNLVWTGVQPKLMQRFAQYNVAYAIPASPEDDA
jgi:pilus assembly protein CpaF